MDRGGKDLCQYSEVDQREDEEEEEERREEEKEERDRD